MSDVRCPHDEELTVVSSFHIRRSASLGGPLSQEWMLRAWNVDLGGGGNPSGESRLAMDGE